MVRQREHYAAAVACFQDVTGRVLADQWDQPGLGVRTVRDLVSHTSRALANVKHDLTRPLPCPGDVADAAAYFEAATATPDMAHGVAELGRASGAALGVALTLAARRRDPAASAGLLRALTGRAPLPANYSVI